MVHKKIGRFIRRITRRKPTVTQIAVAPTRRASVRVTDFASGESVTTRTVTSPTGRTTITRTVRSVGGRSVSPQRRQELIKATIKITPTKIPKIITPLQIRKRKTPQRIRQKIIRQALELPQRIEIKRKQLRQERLTLIRKKGVVKALLSPRVRKIDKQLQELTVGQTAVEFGIGVVHLPSAIIRLIKNPSNIKKIPSNLKEALIEEGKETGKLLLTSPGEGVVKIGAEIFLFKGFGKSIRLTGKVSSKVATRISPNFAKIKDSKLIVPSQGIGKTITLEISKPIKKVKVPLKEQVKLAGRETTAVSAQADRLVNLIRTKRVIRKPIPSESKLKPQTRKLLDRFDEGKITKKEIIILDNRIRLETKGAGSLLERSFFASPKGKLRVSRLGKESPDATLLDILKGDVTFKTLKPQILIFEKVRIQKFPKSLEKIKNKLEKGKTLTKSEGNKLLQFQLKKSGKFKPIGALSKEAEITLSPNEIIRKVKTIAVTEFEGRRVPIIRVEVVKAKPGTTKLLKKVREGKITTQELKKLRSNLKKETGFKTSISRRSRKPKPVVRVPKFPPRRISRRPPTKKRPTARLPGRPPKRPPTRPRPPARPPGRPPARPPRRPPVRPPARPPGRPPARRPPGVPPAGPPIPIRPILIRKRKTLKRKPKKLKSFNVFARPLKRRKGQKRPKLVKVNLRPLTKRRAKDLRNYILDTSLARTGRIKPTSGKPRQPRLNVPTSFSKKTSKKFRRFRTVKRKRVPLTKGKVIERRRHLLDTRQEKRQITLRRRIKQITPKKKKSKSIKRTKSFKRRSLF